MSDKLRDQFTSFIGGVALAPAGERQWLIDPATGRSWASVCLDATAVDEAVASATAAFAAPSWSALTGPERGVLLRRLGELVFANATELGRLESLANGKSHAATTAEMRATAQWYSYYANAIDVHDDVHRSVSHTVDAKILCEPLGVVLAITPFNGALSLGSWKVAPALAVGNAVILKPPAECPGSSIRLAELAIEAGFPPGILNVVIGDAVLGEQLATHPDVAMVTFTGSTATARILGAKVTGMLKRFVCEAGGKSAHIVFEDADLDAAAIAATQGAFSGTGQTCVAGSRVLVQASIYDDFLERYIASTRRIRVGPPASPRSHIGPLASRRQYERVRDFIHETVSAGGRVAFGGDTPVVDAEFAGGYWLSPTIITDVNSDMRICREEVFGPVVTVQPFANEDEAIALANGVEYGLAAGFWTRDAARMRRVSHQLQAGTIWINTYRAINLRVPFGGYKQSGLGRENGIEALKEFSQIKAVVTEYGTAADPFAS
ncbi:MULTISPECIES: aldehyde dehydrogenase family protein [unclassified Chelatococcus]|uniref:aldehyde dehydrogenase family protein n=1 Tax=unclassified Chelatococcus TaxID=2638111 RepID=UPI001BCEF4E4|nr:MULTISPECIES: aldehyde dehydrogenase family protein [unclassified Chelatococcus]MBS7700547.1 aldehyde dehydrogenase family protein [Chelatococcus sp. YT9]MBX3558662.1 aldehyde dehydrogenase family protein [Chelatococcus sp.]